MTRPPWLFVAQTFPLLVTPVHLLMDVITILFREPSIFPREVPCRAAENHAPHSGIQSGLLSANWNALQLLELLGVFNDGGLAC